tara:strand:- start:652 stop:912 length:261 start_codon:yes stop_codon:yes gene_type:complete
MLKKIKNIFYIVAFCIFLLLISVFYFSDQNIKKTNKMRSLYSLNTNNFKNLPLLENDTNNIIEYTDSIEIYKKKKKKYKFFELLDK